MEGKNKNLEHQGGALPKLNVTKDEINNLVVLIKDLEPEEIDDLVKALTLAKIIFRSRRVESKDSNDLGNGGDGSRTGEKIA